MDYLEEISIKLGGKIHSQNCRNANFKEKSARALTIKNYKSFKIQIDDYGNLFALGIKVNSDLAFSINNPDKIFLFDKPIAIEELPYKLYVSDEYHNITSDKYLKAFWNSFIDEVKKLKLDNNESVFFYENWIYFALNSNRNFILILDDIINLISSNDKVFKKTTKLDIKEENIPDNLKALFPLLKKWSVGDDVERDRLIEETGEKQKQKLINTVYPFMIEINKYLDSFGDDALSEEAILLGNLAELISELKTD